MTPEQFTYWLQGKLEGRDITQLHADELKAIQDHLKTVFHKITPEYPNYSPTTDRNLPPTFPPGTVIC